MYQHDGRKLKSPRSERERDAILLRNAVEAPGIVRNILRKIECPHHPVATPRSWIEKWHHSKGLPNYRCDSFAENVAAHHAGDFLVVKVEKVVNPVIERVTNLIRNPPLKEVGVLVQ
jgi:hypothetical protein